VRVFDFLKMQKKICKTALKIGILTK